MTLLNDTLDTLNELPDTHLSLFFVASHSWKQDDKYNFITRQVRLTDDVRRELKQYGVVQLTTLAKDKDLRYEKYGEILSSDQNLVETIAYDSIPHLDDMISLTNFVDCSSYSPEELVKNSIGYVVRLQKEQKAVYLFKKYTQNKALSKKLLTLVLSNDKYDKLDPNTVSLSQAYDFTLLLNLDSSGNIDNGEVLILSRSYFESFFGYRERYESDVNTYKSRLLSLESFDKPEDFIRISSNNSNSLRKLARVLQSSYISTLTHEKIKAIVNTHHVPVEFDESGKIKITDENFWIILRILDDDYLRSDMTYVEYEAHGKKKL